MNTPPAAAEFTIIVPIFNEEQSILRLQQTLNTFLDQAPIPTNVLLVNDGSSDNSQQIIDTVCKTDPRYTCIEFTKNCGLSTALKAGIDLATAPLIGYIDADLQTTPLDFLKMLPFTKEYELVTGIRQERKDSVVKKLSSKIANNIRRALTNDNAVDTGCPLKIMHAATAKKIPFFKGMHRFLPALTLMTGGKVKQIPVLHFERQEGYSKFHLSNRLWKPLIDAFAVRWMMKRYIKYTVK